MIFAKIESYKSAYFENIISNDYAMTMQVKVWISQVVLDMFAEKKEKHTQARFVNFFQKEINNLICSNLPTNSASLAQMYKP